MSKYKSPIGGSGKRTTNLFYRSGISSLVNRIEKLEYQMFCCGDDGLLENLTELSATAVKLGNKDSNKLFVFNTTAACTVTLPEITPDNIGWTATFIVKTNNDNISIINTADGNDTTGDIYVGGLHGVTTTAAQSLFIKAADNDASIVLDSNDANGGGSIGTVITVTAIGHSIAAHSHWHLSGVLHSLDVNSTFVDCLIDL